MTYQTAVLRGVGGPLRRSGRVYYCASPRRCLWKREFGIRNSVALFIQVGTFIVAQTFLSVALYSGLNHRQECLCHLG